MNKYKQAYEEGWRAAADGKSSEANPYTEANLRNHWWDGWKTWSFYNEQEAKSV